MNDKIRTVVVGCGGITNAWFATRAMREDIAIVGLVDLKLQQAEAVRQREGLTEDVICGTDLSAVLAATQPTVVFDCTVPAAHPTVTRTALEAGCHVLGEKPMALSTAEARHSIAAAEKAQRIYAITQTRRWNPHFRRLQAFLAGGAIGPVHTVWVDFAIGANFGGFRAEMPHVLLMDMAVHTIDCARALVGDEPVRVQAEDWNPPASHYEHGASAWAQVRFAGGQRCSYRGTWTAAGCPTTWEGGWRIIGERGTAVWNGGDVMHAERRRDPNAPSAAAGGKLIAECEPLTIPPFDVDNYRAGHDGAIADFVAALRQGTRPECDCRDNFPSLRLILGAIASAEADGVPIDLGAEEDPV